MSNTLIAMLMGAGFAAWVYSKVMRSTGGNTQSALIAAGASGFLAGFILWIVLGFIPTS